MKNEKVLLKNIWKTEKFAQKLAKEMSGRIFALVGDLGTGKTTFTRAFLRALGVKEKITSPTFLIIKNYELRIMNYGRAYHIDCYRLNNEKELLSLGFKKILADPKNIILIEWADKIRNLLSQKDVFWIDFIHSNKKNERVLTIRR
mgnify:CR=1 FL=1